VTCTYFDIASRAAFLTPDTVAHWLAVNDVSADVAALVLGLVYATEADVTVEGMRPAQGIA